MNTQLIFRLLLGLFIGGIFLYFLFKNVQMDTTVQALGEYSVLVILCSIAVFLFGVAARVIRWFYLVRCFNKDLNPKLAMWSYLSGTSLNNLLPMRLGDVYRIVGFRKKMGLSLIQMISLMVVERVLDLAVLLIVFLTFFIFTDTGFISKELSALWGYALNNLDYFIGGIFSLIIVTLILSRADIFKRYRARVRSWVTGFYVSVREAVGFLALSRALFLTVSSWFFEGLVFFLIGSYALNVMMGSSAWGVMSVSTLATLVPSTPGFFGAFDFFAAQGLTREGLTIEKAAAAALVIHLVIWLPITLIGLGYFYLPSSKKVSIDYLSEQDIDSV